MASKKENLKSLFSNSRSRVIILFTAALLLIAVIIGVIKFTAAGRDKTGSTASLGSAPAGIQSIPGAIDPTAQYASLQQAQNVAQAKQASVTGGSAIPTIIRSQSFGDGIESVGPQQGEGSIGFEALSREDNGGAQQSLWIQALQNSNCSQQSVKNVVSQGAVLKDLKKACSCIQLKDDGYQFSDLQGVCSCPELKSAGFNALQMKNAGFTVERLRLCGFSACELRAAGFSVQAMKDGGFSDGELKGAGYPVADIDRAGGIPSGLTADDIRKAGCQVDALRKLREAGVTAAAIRRISGCSAAQLRAAGYSAQDLKNAGFSAADLLKAGYSPADLNQAGYNARDLLDAGLTPADLAAAGYSDADIKAGQAGLPPDMTAESIKQAGCSVGALQRERLAGVSAAMIRKYAGCSADALKAAGFTDADLADAGFTAAQITAAPPKEDENGKLMDAAIKAAGCDPTKLHALMLQGVTAKRIRELNGCSLAALKAAGFSAKDLADAGFTPQELLAAGFTPQDLVQAGLSPAAAIASGRTADCSLDSLRAAKAMGVSAATIKQTLGCSAAQMKAAGYTAAELKDAGFTAAELKNAGFSPADLKNAGFTAKELRAAGFSAADLKNAGFSAGDLKDAGFGLNDLKKAGFSDQDLENAGFKLPTTSVAGIPDLPPPPPIPSTVTFPSLESQQSQAQSMEAANAKQLQEIMNRQQSQIADQRYQQKIEQRSAAMVAAATQNIQDWKNVAVQIYTAGNDDKNKGGLTAGQLSGEGSSLTAAGANGSSATADNIIKAGDVLFAVLDTSVNSDEPGPILATIVSGKLNGAKLIGSFTLPSNANKMVISFNTMSVPGAAKTTSINAYAIDPNTARTALASRVNHHYLLRYGSLFASTFLEGFGNAFQSANTTITIGGTADVANTSIQSGVGRSVLENAVIGLATLGKSWAQIAQQQFSLPTTVDLYSGTGIGVLFTQDLQSL